MSTESVKGKAKKTGDLLGDGEGPRPVVTPTPTPVSAPPVGTGLRQDGFRIPLATRRTLLEIYFPIDMGILLDVLAIVRAKYGDSTTANTRGAKMKVEIPIDEATPVVVEADDEQEDAREE